MSTYLNAFVAINQALSFPSISTKYVNILLSQSEQFHSFLGLVMAKFTMCNLTMETLEMSQEWIAQQLGCCSRTVRRHIETLVKVGFLKKKFRFKGKGKEATNLYKVNPIAKSEGFLRFLAPRFHEIKLYLQRLWREKLRITHNVALQEAILSKQRLGAHMNKGVLPFNNDIFYVNSTVKQEVTRTVPDTKREEKPDGFMSKSLKRVQEALQLTIAGTITFAGYTDDVLDGALQSFRQQRCRIRKEYFWFSSVCAAYRKQLNRTYNLQLVKELQKQYNVTDSTPVKIVQEQLLRSTAPAPKKIIISEPNPEIMARRASLFGDLLNALKK